MAERRMFHAGVVESDAFLDMSPGVQALYFHLGMQADDDGFVNGPRQVCRRCGARMEELQELLDGDFLLWFDGVAVIKHFRMANTLQNDRIKQPRYPEIAKQIYILPNRIYTLNPGKKKENLFFLKEKSLRELRRKTKKVLESTGNPKRRKPNTTQSNPTQPNSTQSKPIIIGNREEENVGAVSDRPRAIDDRPYTPAPQTYDDDGEVTLPSGLGNRRQDEHLARSVSGDSPRTYDDDRENFVPCHCEEPQATWQSQGTLLSTTGFGMTPQDTILLQEERDGVVHLTHEEAYKLLTTVGAHRAKYYIQKLAKFIKEHNANIKDHYDTILKWWEEDGGRYNG